MASARLFISFFACIVLLSSSPGIFFNQIQSERILEANIHSFVWRLVKQNKDDECVYVCVSKCVLWPFVDSWCIVNVIMTSRDAICFPGSCIIELLWGVKRSKAKQHQETVPSGCYIYSQSHWHQQGLYYLSASTKVTLFIWLCKSVFPFTHPL